MSAVDAAAVVDLLASSPQPTTTNENAAKTSATELATPASPPGRLLLIDLDIDTPFPSAAGSVRARIRGREPPSSDGSITLTPAQTQAVVAVLKDPLGNTLTTLRDRLTRDPDRNE